MQIDADKLLENAIKESVYGAVQKNLSDAYKSPLIPLISDALTTNKDALSRLLNSAIRECVADDEFCNYIKAEVRKSLAKTLVQRFGGEIQKQVNALKSDPTTRARIVMAIEDIVDSKS